MLVLRGGVIGTAGMAAEMGIKWAGCMQMEKEKRAAGRRGQGGRGASSEGVRGG